MSNKLDKLKYIWSSNKKQSDRSRNSTLPCIRALVQGLRVQTGHVHGDRLVKVLQDLNCCFFGTLL